MFLDEIPDKAEGARCSAAGRLGPTKYDKIRQNTPKYDKIRQNTTKYIKMHQNTTKYDKMRQSAPKYDKIRRDSCHDGIRIWAEGVGALASGILEDLGSRDGALAILHLGPTKYDKLRQNTTKYDRIRIWAEGMVP